MKTDARTAAMRVLLRIDEQQGYSNLALKQIFQRNEMDERDRAFAETLVYGVLERRITLDYIIASNSKMKLAQISLAVLEALRIGTYQLMYMDRVPPSAAINESVKLTKKFDGVKSAGFVNAVLHSIHRNGKEIAFPPEKNWKTHLSVKYSCPQWIVKLLRDAYGQEHCEGILADVFNRPPMTVRVNTSKTSAKELIEILADEGVEAQQHHLLENALNIKTGVAIETLKSFSEGMFHVQDAASQICCEELGACKGERVADVCAAPGGKTFTLAQFMENNGYLMSCDLHEHRVKLIADGACRLGFHIVDAKQRDASNGEIPSELFDKVLCDVPCSGLGVMRRKPEIKYKDKESINELPQLQYEILSHSAKMVRNGGCLIYSTCSLNPSENGEVVERFLSENPQWEAKALNTKLQRAIDEPISQITLMPHVHSTDGFFIAKLQRKD